jgi:hypothetical protein
MRSAMLVACCAILLADGQGASASEFEDRARALRDARDAIDAASHPEARLYERYFETFPDTFRGLAAVLHSGDYEGLLLRPGEQWNFGQAYKATMCRAYQYVDHARYMRKLLKIGVEANDWGGFAADHERALYPGETYKNLVWGRTCETVTEASVRERVSVIYALSPEFSDSQLEAIFNSLSWEDLDRVPIDWFLKGLCAHHSDRCALTAKLHDKYIKDFELKYRVDEP